MADLTATAASPAPTAAPTPHGLELLAPAGNWECARAAVANGADAIYFGLPRFNARLRADNFSEADLPELMRFLHSHGVRGFVAMNTLIFTSELPDAEAQLKTLAAAGVDAIIVQDLGLVRLAKRVAPTLEIHASTQMTITSPEGLDFAHDVLGLDRAVLARELSLREIEKFHATAAGSVPLEVFVHGALCVAYSGQCLTSEALGQRSANRGECAQACRMPYEIVVDGEKRDLGAKRYLLSPQDLAAHDEIADLVRLGVSSFKIEGRLKSPEYVAAVTRVYRKAIDAAASTVSPERTKSTTAQDRYALEMAFSRGLFSGWMHGVNHQELVHARFGKKRGAYLGDIVKIGPDWVELGGLAAPVQAGDGLVIENPADTNNEQGGRLFAVQGRRLVFERRSRIDFRRIATGLRVYKTDDPKLNEELRRTWNQVDAAEGRLPVRWIVSGKEGAPLTLEAVCNSPTGTHRVAVESAMPLQAARTKPLIPGVLEHHLSRLGGTPFHMVGLASALEGDVMLPLSELNRLRREAVDELGIECFAIEPIRFPRPEPVSLRPAADPTAPAELSVLVRSMDQLQAALDAGVRTVYVDFEDIRRAKDAVGLARSHASAASADRPQLFLATPRIQKAGEDGFFKLIERAEPDGVLIRNLGGIRYFSGLPALKKVGDFSLNVANPLTAELLLAQGLDRLTVSYDLNIQQVLDLLRAAPPAWFELTLHQHMPMFHMEHCVFAAFLSNGKDYTDCGRPCEAHRVELRDRVGQRHPLLADVGCRNTLFRGQAQTGARFFPDLRATGLNRFRVELLRESAAESLKIIDAYQRLLSGTDQGELLWQKLHASSQLGVTEGTLVQK